MSILINTFRSFNYIPRIVSMLSLVGVVILLLCLSSCKKPLIYSKENLHFYPENVVFDTVFTTIGSTTQRLKIYNKSGSILRVSEVELVGGVNSPFRINLDGLQGTRFNDIEIEGKDSLYVFVEVTLDPNGDTLPMVIEDSIRFKTNGKDQYVVLTAWGQDVYYHYSDLQGPSSGWDLNEGVWPNDKPHLIYGAAFVDEGKELIIQAGTKIYLHKLSTLFVYKGKLTINGELDNEVIFQGDRLEENYQKISGQYYGVYFREAMSSSINYAIIKNGTAGIHIEQDGNNGSNPTVFVRNTILQNNSHYGIINFLGGKIKAENCLIINNGVHGFINVAGSGFEFNHCTIAGYKSGQQHLPVVGISDFYTDTNNITSVVNINGSIKNSVLYGTLDHEIAFDLSDIGTHSFNISHSLIKFKDQSNDPIYSNIIWNSNPSFKNPTDNDFQLWSNSPLIGQGIATSITHDIKNQARNNPPTIGAYEF